MKFQIDKPKENLLNFARRIGYTKGFGENRDNEANFIRALNRGGYPRFHLYLKEENTKLAFNLHLDQKKPSYQGTTAHGGEHDGPLVDAEMRRIKEIIDRPAPRPENEDF